MANTSIDLVGLDFNTIKTNLKTYLKNNTAFKDVDFEGSNISVLIDLLSYNTYMNSFYTNMVASEMFLDTAQLRDSVISHAKMLNYTPSSFVSAKASVNLSITPSTSVTNVVVPKGTTFTSRVGSNTYTFSTNENLVFNNSNNGVFSSNVEIFEGSYVTDSFTMNYGNTSQRFVLSNPTVDIGSVSISVIEDNGDSTLNYVRSESLIGITSSSKVYFIQAAENSQYEIKFGDNVFGRKPKDGSVIVAEYRNSSGELPNGASVFSNDGSIDGHSNVSVVTISSASQGSINESIESIRFNAPRNFQVQSRAVTASDYETLLKTNFSDIQSISAYGGEEMDPPQFGKVFISVDVENAEGTPQNRILAFSNFIKDKTPLSIDVVFVNPDFMYAKIECNVKYNVNLTSLLSNDIKTLVLSKISSYNENNLNGFKKTLFYSKLLKEIDSADSSVISNDTLVRAIKTFTPTTGINQSFSINFGFELESETGLDLVGNEYHYGHTITSSNFVFNGYRSSLVDDTRGKIYIAKSIANLSEIVQEVGTIDYNTGIILINNFNVSSFDGSSIKIYARSKSKDFGSSRNTILTINDEDISVSVTPVKI
ncbi:hypothetical protein EB118_02985 [bacterium]|nr:hypothetical protein [bacterium]